MIPYQASRINPVLTLDRIEPFVHESNGEIFGNFFDIRFASAFQPIFSLAHRRIIGYEALARPSTHNGIALPPRTVFDQVVDESENIFLDRLCRLVHARNFSNLTDDGSWLFLNIDPTVTAFGRSHGAFFGQMLEKLNLPPHRVVVEILEGHIRDESVLYEAARYYKELGCLVAIDDFGAGQSNFERLWRIQPDIVKLDRSILTQATASRTVRRIVPNLVNLIHEAGCLVLMEGIENEAEAMVALDSDIDFVQGYYFARPAATIDTALDAPAKFDALFQNYKTYNKQISSQLRQDLHAYEDAFQVLVKQFKAGATPAEACRSLLEMPRSLRCYVLDHGGRQFGESIYPNGLEKTPDPRFSPLRDSTDATWARRHYFRQALSHPGSLQVSQPYLSIAEGSMCITLSTAIFSGKEIVVLCADLKWND